MSDPKRFWQGVAMIVFAIVMVVAGNSLNMAISPWQALMRFGLIVGVAVAIAVFVAWRGETVEAETIDTETGRVTKIEARTHKNVGDMLSDLPHHKNCDPTVRRKILNSVDTL